MMACADSSGTCGDNLTWTYVEATYTLTISGTGDMNNYYYNAPWYSLRNSIEKVIIKNGVTSIGKDAFFQCTGLTSVTIPNSVTSIGEEAFSMCSGLTSVTIPNSVTSIGSSAFFQCSGLTSVTIPNSVTSIGRDAFYNCYRLTSVHISDLAAWCNISFEKSNSNPLSYAHHLYLNGTEVTDLAIPNSVTSIGNWAFLSCSSLTSVTIPNSVTSIGEDAFSGCSSLGLMVVLCPTPPTATNLGTSTPYVIVPEGCEEAYANTDGWKDLRIIPYEEPTVISFKDPNVKDICVEHWDWHRCSDNSHNGDGELDTWEAMSVTDIGKTFKNNTTIMKFDEFKYFKSVTSIPEEAFRSCTNLRAITIPNTVTSIGNQAFNGCSGLTSVTIPNSVTTIGTSAFYDCSGLNSVHISDLATWCNISFSSYNTYSNPLSYAHHLYLNGTEVTDLIIPNSVTAIGPNAFTGCSGLTSVTIPNSVTSIGYYAFKNCSGLTSVTIPNSVTSIGYYAFQNCSGLTSVTIGNSVTSIGSEVFSGCSGLTAVNITDLGAWCGISFANGNCNPLNQVHHLRLNGEEVTDLTIPDGVTEIGNYAFYGGTGFTSVNIPVGVTKIGTEAFRNCSSLTTVTLPEGVTTVGNNAFNTGNMKNVTLPSTLYGFGNAPFGDKLRSVAVTTDEPPLIGETAFPNRTSALLIVPQGSTAAYQEEMCWQDFKNILEYPGGDVNADGDTNMVDVVDIVRFVVGTPSDMFIEVMADLNNSKSVNVADAVVLVNEIVGDVNYAKPMWAPAMTDDVLALAGDGNRLSLLMEGNGQYAAFQCDLWLPEGMDVTDVQLNDSRRQGHQLLYNKVGDGHYRVVAISTAANSFRGTDGELLGLTLDGFATDDIRMDNIHFVTTRGDDIAFDDLDLNYGNEGVATGIVSTAKEKESGTIYNLNGQRLIVPQKGLNIVNGKKVVVK